MNVPSMLLSSSVYRYPFLVQYQKAFCLPLQITTFSISHIYFLAKRLFSFRYSLLSYALAKPHRTAEIDSFIFIWMKLKCFFLSIWLPSLCVHGKLVEWARFKACPDQRTVPPHLHFASEPRDIFPILYCFLSLRFLPLTSAWKSALMYLSGFFGRALCKQLLSNFS